MTPSPKAQSLLRRFLRYRRGNVLIITVLMTTVLMSSVGIAVDYGRMVHFRDTLQGAVDAAAIAGATAYVGPGKNSSNVLYSAVGQSIAIGYVNRAGLPKIIGNLSVTAAPSATAAGYFVQVSATASIPATFLAIWRDSLIISATATAENAIFNIQISAAGWNSNAYDQNTVYYYMFDPNSNVIPSTSDLHPLFSNAPGFNNPSTINLAVSATQQIAFAFKNITGGNTVYAKNGYGAQLNDVHWLYSPYPENPDTTHNLTTPNAVAYPNTVANAGHNGETYRPPSNCSLEMTTATATMVSSTSTPPVAPAGGLPAGNTGNCNDSQASNSNFNATKALSAPSCSTLNSTHTTGTGKTVVTTYIYTYAQFNWNDMGGGTDDYDYNDGVYYMSCPSPNGAANVVTLTQ